MRSHAAPAVVMPEAPPQRTGRRAHGPPRSSARRAVSAARSADLPTPESPHTTASRARACLRLAVVAAALLEARRAEARRTVVVGGGEGTSTSTSSSARRPKRRGHAPTAPRARLAECAAPAPSSACGQHRLDRRPDAADRLRCQFVEAQAHTAARVDAVKGRRVRRARAGLAQRRAQARHPPRRLAAGGLGPLDAAPPSAARSAGWKTRACRRAQRRRRARRASWPSRARAR